MVWDCSSLPNEEAGGRADIVVVLVLVIWCLCQLVLMMMMMMMIIIIIIIIIIMISMKDAWFSDSITTPHPRPILPSSGRTCGAVGRYSPPRFSSPPPGDLRRSPPATPRAINDRRVDGLIPWDGNDLTELMDNKILRLKRQIQPKIRSVRFQLKRGIDLWY